MKSHVMHSQMGRRLPRRPFRRARTIVLGIPLVMLLIAGCASPPSVSPLLRISASAVEAERSHLAADLERQSQWYEQQRQMLHSGFAADLEAQIDINADWVQRGVNAYVTARELVLRDELVPRQ